MKNSGRTGVLGIVSCVLLILWSSCTEEQPVTANSKVDAQFRLKSNAVLKGKLTIDEAYLKLDRIHVIGNYGSQNIANVTHAIPAGDPPYRLTRSDTAQVTFSIPTSGYDQLDFNFFLFQDNYQLVFINNPVQETPAPPQGDLGQTPGQGGDGSGDGDGSGNDDDNEGGDSSSGGDDEDSDEDEGDDDEDEGDDEDDDDDEDEGEDDDDDEDEDEGDDDDDDDDDDDEKKNDDKSKGKKDNKGNGNKNGQKDDEDEDNDDRISGTANNHTLDLSNFFQNAKPALLVIGTYHSGNIPLKIIFAVTGHEKFSVRAMQDDSPNVVLSLQNFAEVTFDPERWFEAITTAGIESASRQTYQGQAVIFIHKDHNAHLYESLLSRLEASATMNFTEPPTP